MYSSQIEALKNNILSKNTYFNGGYANAVKNNKGVYADKTTKEKIAVFPNDRLGNYFYIRLEQNASFAGSNRFAVDCGSLGTMVNIRAFIIAVVKKADSEILVANLIASIKEANHQAVLNDMNWNREFIANDEMSEMEEKDRNAILQRLKDETIVRVSFTYPVEILFKKSDCIINPCNC